MAIVIKQTKSWKFNTKKEAIEKLGSLKNPDTYEVVRNRDKNGAFANGWILRKRR